jgi:uncharacterized protein (TIRG00374 family)
VSPAAPSRPPELARSVRIAASWALLFLVLVALAVPWLGVDATLERLARLGPGMATLVLGLSLLNYLLRAVRWQGLCRAMALRLPFGRNTLYYVAGFAFTITPGKLGEVIRLWLLRRDCGAAYERTLGLLVMDRVSDAVPLLALCLVGASRFAGQAWSLAAVTVMVLGSLALVLRPLWLALLVKAAYARLRRAPRLFARLLRLLRALQALVALRVLAQSLFLGLLGWSAEVLGAWLVLHGLGAEVDLAATAFVFAFGMLVGAIPLFPGGVGGAEGTMVALLVLLGVDPATALTATALIRLATLGFAVVLGFLALPAALRRPRPYRRRSVA